MIRWLRGPRLRLRTPHLRLRTPHLRLRTPHLRLRTPHLRLRTKVSVFFGLLALVASASLSVVTYTIARSSLLDQRATAAKQQAINNAGRVLVDLRSDPSPEEFREAFDKVDPEQENGFNLVQLADGEPVTLDVNILEAFPPQLRESVEAGTSAIQRFSFNGEYYIGVGVHLTDVDADYFEAFPLTSTNSTLRALFIAFAVGSGVTVLLAGAIGVWTGRRLLRPLGRVTDVAGEIAAGGLHTRVAPEPDRDLEPLVDSFNDMADAVQARIEREQRFVSDVSHELRSPITALAAATDVLDRRRDVLPERTQQAIDVVIDQVRRFDGMVLDLLDLSRMDAGAADVHLERVDVVDLSRRIAGRFGFVDLPVEVCAGAATGVTIDRVRYERILGNMLDNARNHAGGPIRVVIEPAPDPFVDVVVEDAGPGVAAEEHTRIFERFARGSASLHRVGTGLGLALVAEHSRALGGDAWVEGRQGGGARFVVRLMRSADDDTGTDT